MIKCKYNKTQMEISYTKKGNLSQMPTTSKHFLENQNWRYLNNWINGATFFLS